MMKIQKYLRDTTCVSRNGLDGLLCLSTTLRPQEHEKTFKLLQDGLLVPEIYGTADGYVSGDKIVQGLKPITNDLRVEANLRVHVMRHSQINPVGS